MNQTDKEILEQWLEKAEHDLIARARYPHHYIAPELSEAEEYYQIALQIKAMVSDKISLS